MTGLPLRLHYNPRSICKQQSRRFPLQNQRHLASFAIRFHWAITLYGWPTAKRSVTNPPFSLQGRLRCTCHHSFTKWMVTLAGLTWKISSLRGRWVGFRMPLRNAQRPLLPAHALVWATKAHTRNFIDVPFNDILTPSSISPNLTRILHHVDNYIIYL